MSQGEKIIELLAEIKALKAENAKYKEKKDYGLVWDNERNKEEIVDDCKKKLPILERVKDKEIITDKTKPMNLMVEGDNYHALTCLNYTHRGKIDVIYIDPPYNTGKAKEWKFNDKYVKLNKEDGGNRKFILCTNNENNNGNGHGGIAEAVCYPRIQKAIQGYKKNGDGEWVAGLGGNLHYFKADENSFISIEMLKNISDEKRLELTLKAGELIVIRENIFDEKEHSKYSTINISDCVFACGS